ncbi:hypothetical protein FB570_12340 [Streptomyces sp. T12]|nr:hypothetical protein FB570_12340 [Streptomyces sp. T12]
MQRISASVRGSYEQTMGNGEGNRFCKACGTPAEDGRLCKPLRPHPGPTRQCGSGRGPGRGSTTRFRRTPPTVRDPTSPPGGSRCAWQIVRIRYPQAGPRPCGQCSGWPHAGLVRAGVAAEEVLARRVQPVVSRSLCTALADSRRPELHPLEAPPTRDRNRERKRLSVTVRAVVRDPMTGSHQGSRAICRVKDGWSSGDPGAGGAGWLLWSCTGRPQGCDVTGRKWFDALVFAALVAMANVVAQ